MNKIRTLLLCLIVAFASMTFSQSNLLENGSFEAHWQNQLYPKLGYPLHLNHPYPWIQYRTGDDAAWFIDSVWVPVGQNNNNPNLQNGHFKSGVFNANYPWQTGSVGDSMTLQTAYDGTCYVGIDLKADYQRSGIQTKISDCPLNFGDYTLSLGWSRVYQEDVPARATFSLSDQSGNRKYVIDRLNAQPSSYVSGTWNNLSYSFQLRKEHPNELDLRWFAITGQACCNSNPRHYMYFDDVRVFRPCDVSLDCWPIHDQICSSIEIHQAPDDPIWVRNISNASNIYVLVSSLNGTVILDTNFTNLNGMPDFKLSRLLFPVASTNYAYEVTVTNPCGGITQSGYFPISAIALYNNPTIWTDSTSNWSPAPIPCCLSTLTLNNMQIVGDVNYIVRDNITVQNGVSVAPNSHVTLQAGQVIELTDVELDGTNSSIEILEMPCPNRMACGGGSGGIATLNAGVIEVPDNNSIEDFHQEQISTELGTASNEIQKDGLSNKGLPTLSAFPNPFTDQLTISFSLEAESEVDLQILDLQMRPVRSLLTNSSKNKGGHEIAADLKELPAGIFLVQMDANGVRMHQRIVKQ